MKRFFICWLITTTVAFLLNGLFHGLLAADFFDSSLAHFGDSVRKMSEFSPLPAALLELLLVYVLVYLISSRSTQPSMGFGTKTGALLSLANSATWSLANMATFKSWPWSLTLLDVAWHTALGALLGALVVWLWNKIK